MNSALLTFACLLFFAQEPAMSDQGTTTPAAPAEVRLEARNNPEPVFNPVKVANGSTAELEHSTAFRKATEEAWRATHNGAAPYEAGFSIEKDGHPGKIQLSIFATVNAKTHLSIHASPTALGSLHVHTKYGEAAPSPGDIQSAKMLRKVVYVESRNGLYRIDGDGNVCHVFDDQDWFNKK